MRTVWSVADSIVSPLGLTSEENYSNLRKGVSGVSKITAFNQAPVYAAFMPEMNDEKAVTRFERLCITALDQALTGLALPSDRTLFILSSTKGNIDRLEKNQADHPRIHLPATAKFLAARFGFKHHTVVSNACISGVLALIVAKRFLEHDRYDHAVVVGADVLSQFILSGFQSLHALSTEPCKPFDADRSGINLGEAASVMVLSTMPERCGGKPGIRLAGEGLSNDANHISGPSRTGSELAQAVQQAMITSDCQAKDIDLLSAHGTATVYNDEMEAKAFALAGLSNAPLVGLKGYYGHTLGAAGVLETVVSIHELQKNELIPTRGFKTQGVSQPLAISQQLETRSLHTALKTGSGFGGCNAALIIKKEK